MITINNNKVIDLGAYFQSGGSDDLQIVRESLQSLRTSFAGNDPKHHTIDNLEQSISSLMERLTMNESSIIRVSSFLPCGKT